jgi:hypothetical protein
MDRICVSFLAITLADQAKPSIRAISPKYLCGPRIFRRCSFFSQIFYDLYLAANYDKKPPVAVALPDDHLSFMDQMTLG